MASPSLIKIDENGGSLKRFPRGCALFS
jgi:hypothetical protein